MTIKLERITGPLSKIEGPRGPRMVINTDVYTDLEVDVIGSSAGPIEQWEHLLGFTVTVDGKMHEGYFLIYNFILTA